MDAVTASSGDALKGLVGEVGAVLYLDAEVLDSLSGVAARRMGQLAGLRVGPGVYAFRRDGSWKAIVSQSEHGQVDNRLFQHSLTAGSDVWAALMALNVGWESATVVGRTVPDYQPGDGVRLTGGSDEVGTVAADGMATEDGWNYRVRFGSDIRIVPESGLIPVEDLEDSPTAWRMMSPASLEEFRLLLAVTKLRQPLSDVVYALGATRTVFRPYQFKPLLKLLQTNSQRLLIADEVGLGKTIEAGLIWTELHQRAEIRRALVVCPAALTRKWRSEMKRRFDVDLEIITRSRMEEFAEELEAGNDPSLIAAISLESLRSAHVLENLAALRPRFDLVIVDEAHYLRNRDTRSFALGELLADWSDVLLFLSATPLNLGTDDLFNLLNLLAEDEFPDSYTFRDQIEPNGLINEAARRLTSEPASFPGVLAALAQLQNVALGPAVLRRPQVELVEHYLQRGGSLSQRELSLCKRSLLELNTLSSVVTRTRKVDVPDAKATRVAVTIDVAWRDDERRFYDAVLAWARARALANNGVVGFATIMPLRQAASCLPAMRELLREKYLDLGVDDDDFDDSTIDVLSSALLEEADEHVTTETLSASMLKSAAMALGATDSKFDVFLTKLRQTRESGISQVMVFSFFRRTLSYLRQRLAGEFSVRVMDGSVLQDDRVRIMEDFREGKFDVLLISEVGSEGLDFEFVGALVNYDLPWNPMRVEQRIGRLDRFGQKHERIHIFNFHVPGTIETDIFDRLYQRIRVFEESIGELEPILRNQVGELTRAVLDPRRSDAERQAEVDRIGLAIENKRADLDDLQSQAAGLMTGLDEILIDGFEDSVVNAGRYIGANEAQLLIARLIHDTGASMRAPRGKSSVWEIRGCVDLERRLVQVGRDLRSRRVEDLSRRVRAGETMYVVFDSAASIEVSADLVAAGHPLLIAAVEHLRDADLPHWRHGCVAIGGAPESGRFAALLSVLEITGAQPARELVCVALDTASGQSSAEVGDFLMSAAARGELAAGEPALWSEDVVAALEDLMIRHRDGVERERTQSNDARIEARSATLAKTYGYKIAKARSTLANVQQAGRASSIERLYEGRITNLEARLAADLAELEQKKDLTVTWQPVALVDVELLKAK